MPACEPLHLPVLADEVIGYLGDVPGDLIVDCTLGLGGHARLLLDSNPALRLIGIDADEQNCTAAAERLSGFGERVRVIRANFGELGRVLAEAGVEGVGGILADLGVSSNQLADPLRGLSFEVDGPLDMRLDSRLGKTAADLVNTLPESELADLLYLQSQERHSRRIARRICEEREWGRLDSTVLLARLVEAAVGRSPGWRRSRIHPATRTFMALRMSVNDEVGCLRRLLEQAPGCLGAGGRVAVVTFHSGEDQLVKQDFRRRARSGAYRLLTKKPIVASETERGDNPRSRSAKLRVAELATKA